jgi:hypothetical protein
LKIFVVTAVAADPAPLVVTFMSRMARAVIHGAVMRRAGIRRASMVRLT